MEVKIIYLLALIRNIFLPVHGADECAAIPYRLGFQKQRLIIFNFYGPDQDVLDSCTRRFSKMRDLYKTKDHRPCPSAAYYNFANIFSSHQNATLVSYFCAMKLELDSKQFSNLYTVSNAVQGAPYTIYDLWKESKNSQGVVGIIQQEQMHLNYAYCSKPKLKLERPWNLKTYASVQYPVFWTIMVLSGAMVVILLKYERFDSQYTTSESFLLALLALIGSPHVKPGRKSFILILWMLACQVISVVHTGIISSKIIAPNVENDISTLSELSAEKYNLLSALEETKAFVKSIAFRYFANETYRISKLEEDTTALQQLFTRSIVMKTITQDFISTLASGRKLVAVSNWPSAIYTVIRANENLQSEGRSAGLHCYIGKRLIPSLNIYYFSHCPSKFSNCQLDKMLQRLFETGIFHYWNLEYKRMRYAKRVQNRMKVINPTRMKYDFESDSVMPISIEGRVSKVFTIWLMGIVGSTVRALQEIRQRKAVTSFTFVNDMP